MSQRQKNMSDYVFHCFKGHVTTGPVPSLSVHATDVLTEGPRMSPNVLQPARNTQYSVHIYTENGWFVLKCTSTSELKTTEAWAETLHSPKPSQKFSKEHMHSCWQWSPFVKMKRLIGYFNLHFPMKKSSVHKDAVRFKNTLVLLQA